jgi:hypothetical protein
LAVAVAPTPAAWDKEELVELAVAPTPAAWDKEELIELAVAPTPAAWDKEELVELGEKPALPPVPDDGSNCADDEVSLAEEVLFTEEGSLTERAESLSSDVVAAFASQSSPMVPLDLVPTATFHAGLFEVAPSPVHAVAAFASLTPPTTMLNPIRTAAFLTELYDIAPSPSAAFGVSHYCRSSRLVKACPTSACTSYLGPSSGHLYRTVIFIEVGLDSRRLDLLGPPQPLDDLKTP